ncbi:MAG: TIGR03943 family protein [Clostridia bacterium]|nr:TIGR03943 family protein [Clostridia bacterium]
METPIYLFNGFLEAGKTKFIQETLADPKFFQDGEKTLVILFEEGEEELVPAEFASREVYIEVISSKNQLNPDKLAALQRKHKATRVIIEYNGMWLLTELFSAMPENWVIYQVIMFADSETFTVYNANMRNLMVDKISVSELIVFNRCDSKTDKNELHKIVRAISRRCDIIYENKDGSYEYDQIEDPLPFDVNQPEIEIGDNDYALWYRDLSENMSAYDGKTVTFLGMVTKNDELPKNSFVIGRPIMTCCADDITYSGLLCEDKNSDKVAKGDWIRITAEIKIKACELYGKVGPVLKTVSYEKTNAPEDPVATFY